MPVTPERPQISVRVALAFDFGLKRIGAAVGDTLTQSAAPRGAIAVHTAKVTLAVYKRVAHGKFLSHMHHCVVNCNVSVRVVFSQHVSNYSGAFSKFYAMPQP